MFICHSFVQILCNVKGTGIFLLETFGILYEDPTDPLPKNSYVYFDFIYLSLKDIFVYGYCNAKINVKKQQYLFFKTIILTIILVMEAKYMIVELIVKQKTLLLSA